MKNSSSIFFVITNVILLSLSTAIFADESTTHLKKSESAKSNVNDHSLQKEPAITNEAEYAEFVKKHERAGQTSSVRSVSLQVSKHSTVSAVSSSTASSRGRNP